VAHYAHDAEGAQSIADQVKARGGRGGAVQSNFEDTHTPERVVHEAVEILGGLDVLVNNAAWDPGALMLTDTDAAIIGRMLAVNVTAPLLCIRAAVEPLARNPNGGCIINIGSIQSTHSLPGHAAYAASKGALDSMTRQLAVELGPQNIRVNSVNPGFVCIERTTRGKAEMELRQCAERVPLQRLGIPEDIAGIISMLCQPAASYLTGQIITVDGGSIRYLPTHIDQI